MSERMYIGTKIIAAKPMNKMEWEASQGRSAQNYALAGMNIPNDVPGYQVRYEDGYTSWSPKDTFERAYREITDAEKQLMASGKA